MGVEECGESECRPVMGRIGVEPIQAISLYVQTSRLPQGLLSQESKINR